MPKVIVASGNTSRVPEFGGSWWVRMQYVLGLRKLGIDAYWIDRLEPFDRMTLRRPLEYFTTRFRLTVTELGLADRYCIVYNEGERYFGMDEKQFLSLVDEADLLINFNGHLPPESPLNRIPKRAFLDVDPGFTQMWAFDEDAGFDRHNLFFTVGQNVGEPDFKIPTHGVDWEPILPPVALDHWTPAIDETCRRFSTIADWRGAQDAMFESVHYGGKRSEFIRMLRLPRDSGQEIELALTISLSESEDLGLLGGNEWIVLNPCQYAGDPFSYREFIRTSRAEFSVAKNGYVRSNSGWISDRTACYLACGKPALVQSTGFEKHIPTGKGLVTFRDLKEAIAGIHEINANYAEHCQAARRLAEEYFDSDLVLGKILRRAGIRGRWDCSHGAS